MMSHIRVRLVNGPLRITDSRMERTNRLCRFCRYSPDVHVGAGMKVENVWVYVGEIGGESCPQEGLEM
jgi:hypothetical protein